MISKKLLWLLAQTDTGINLTPGNHTFAFVAAIDAEDVKLFVTPNTGVHPNEAFTVYINGEQTNQSYLSLSFAANDEVVITGTDVVSFPSLTSYDSIGQYFASISPLPFMTVGRGSAAQEADSWFSDSTALSTVPSDLFVNNPDLYYFAYTFSGSNITSIPQALFQYCNSKQQLNFQNTFSRCKQLTSLSDYLFKLCSNAPRFSWTFAYCEGLQNIPGNIFDDCIGTEEFPYTFAYCTQLSSIPENLFNGCINAKTFKNTFDGCSLQSIPENLFTNNQKATEFDSTFHDCINLTSIPENLFANNLEAIVFDSTFSYCSNLSFVPEKIFANNTKAESFRNVFSFDINLTSVPEKLFANNSKVTDFSYAFYYCKNLTSVPENLFANNLEATNFDYTFNLSKWANTLDGRTPRLKIGSPNVTSCKNFCMESGVTGSITILVPAGSTTEATFRAYAELDSKVVIETF